MEFKKHQTKHCDFVSRNSEPLVQFSVFGHYMEFLDIIGFRFQWEDKKAHS